VKLQLQKKKEREGYVSSNYLENLSNKEMFDILTIGGKNFNYF